MKPSLLALLLIAGLAVAAEPAKEAPAAPEPKPFYDPAAPSPTVDPTKPTPEPAIEAPAKGKPVAPERKKKAKQ